MSNETFSNTVEKVVLYIVYVYTSETFVVKGQKTDWMTELFIFQAIILFSYGIILAISIY